MVSPASLRSSRRHEVADASRLGPSVAMLEPSDCRPRFVIQMPFLTPYGAARALSRDTVDSGLRSESWTRRAALTYDLSTGPPDDDLCFQVYAAQIYEDLRSLLPHCVLELKDPLGLLPEDLKSLFDHPDRCDQDTRSRGAIISLREFSTGVWDSGIGLVSVTYQVSVQRGITWKEYRDDVVIPAYDTVRRHCGALVRAALSALPAESAPAARSGQTPIEQSSAIDTMPDVLWAHLLYLIEVPSSATVNDCGAVAAQLVTDPEALVSSNEADEVVLSRVGLDACCVYSDESEEYASALARLIGVHTVAWSAAISFQTELLRQLASITGENSQLSIRELDDIAAKLLRVHHNVKLFHTSMKGAAVHLKSEDASYWRTLEEKWGLNAQLTTLSDQLAALEHLHERLTAAITASRGRKLNNLALVFTFSSIVGLGFGIINFSQQRLRRPQGVALAVAVVLIVLSLVAWGITVYRFSERRRRW